MNTRRATIIAPMKITETEFGAKDVHIKVAIRDVKNSTVFGPKYEKTIIKNLHKYIRPSETVPEEFYQIFVKDQTISITPNNGGYVIQDGRRCFFFQEQSIKIRGDF